MYNNYVFPFLVKQFGITDWKLKVPQVEDEIAALRKREIEVNIAASTKF